MQSMRKSHMFGGVAEPSPFQNIFYANGMENCVALVHLLLHDFSFMLVRLQRQLLNCVSVSMSDICILSVFECLVRELCQCF